MDKPGGQLGSLPGTSSGIGLGTGGLTLPTRKFGGQRFKPPSPKDTTPIILNGNPIDRSDLTPIVDDQIIKNSSPKINLLETPEAVNDLFLNSNQNRRGQEEHRQEKDNIEPNEFEEQEEQEEQEQQEFEEQEKNDEQEEINMEERIEKHQQEINNNEQDSSEEEDLSEIQSYSNQSPPSLISPPYRRFNPPFPDQTSSRNSTSITSPSVNRTPVGFTQNAIPTSASQSSNRLAFVTSVESTEESPNGYQKSPKITSPADISIVQDQKFSNYRPMNNQNTSKSLVQTQLNPIRLSQTLQQNNGLQQSAQQPAQQQSPIYSQQQTQSSPQQSPVYNQTISQGFQNSSASSPKIVRQDSPSLEKNERSFERVSEKNTSDKSNIERNPERIHLPSPPSSSAQFSKQETDKLNQELIGKAHDCYLKYQILQKSWPEYKFPNLEEKMVYTNPQFIVDTYNKSVERIQIDMDVNQYKIALIIMFLVIEVVCVKFLGLDAGGYTLSQIKAMNRYEKMLIEIGEKRLLTGESSWPPEVRILFIGLLNCGLFILMKYLSSVLGPELVGYISPIVNGLFSGVLDTSKTANLPDEIPQRQQDITGMLGSVASMAASALSNNSSSQQNNYRNQPQQPTKASRRPIFRE